MNLRTALVVLSLTAAALASSGCVGATRLPTRIKGPSSQTFAAKELDFSFLNQHGTTRDDVLRRLNMIDTSYSNPHVFWGRWGVSKWAYWWFIAGNNTAAGDARRVWRFYNLLVIFDDAGTVQQNMILDDAPALWQQLHLQLASAPPLDLLQPLPIAGTACCPMAHVALTSDSLRLIRRKGKDRLVDITPQQIVRFSHSTGPKSNSTIEITCHCLQFAAKTPFGKNLNFCSDPPGVAAIFQYLQEFGRKDLRWE